jgi:DNA-binding NtrC family response regulator
MKPRVLVVDDENSICKLLESRLVRDGYEVSTASHADHAEERFKRDGEYGVVITDIKMPGRDGLELTSWIKKNHPSTKVLVITGHGDKTHAIQSLKCGASDYLEKPFDMAELSHSVERVSREYLLERENADMIGRLEARVERVEGKKEDQYWFVSKSSSMEKVNDWLMVLRREAMRGDAEEPTVLIQGESGTGKEGIARMIHAGSRRGKGPWVAVNCANFSEQLLESELFGHERGAFTGANDQKKGLFEIAKGGTLFLDEIGEMDIKVQARILRVLQEKQFRRVGGTEDLHADVRVVTATNRDLEECSAKGTFREDLFHRLNRVVIDMPALRERKDDVISMAREFAERAFAQRGKKFEGFTPEAEEATVNYTWPGNVRELLNVIERVALVRQGCGPISVTDMSLSRNLVSPDKTTIQRAGLSVVTSPFDAPLDSGSDGYMELKKKWSDSFEREYLTAALERHDGNVSAAAREARIDRSNFLRLLRRHRIQAGTFRKTSEGVQDDTQQVA